MNRIGVISAYNPRNYGMYSVDLAAHTFFGSICQQFTPIVTQRRTRVGRLSFRLLRDPALFESFDKLVYWGDFLNNPMWGANDYSRREMARHRVADQVVGWNNWLELYLQIKQRHPHLKVYACGGCFLGADAPALAHARTPLREFVSSAEMVAPRDSESLRILRELVPDGPLVQGMDNAWLLPFDAAPAQRGASNCFVYFFGRTLRDASHAFIHDLARASGLRPVLVDWMNVRRPRFMAQWNFDRMHRAIAGARFVVTDAYHLAINALNRRVPVVCLYDSAQRASDGSLADAKKHILMQQLGLGEWLVDVRAGAALDQQVLEHLGRVSDAARAEAFARIDRLRDAWRATLTTAFSAQR